MKKLITIFALLGFLFSSASFANIKEEKIYLIDYKEEFLKSKNQKEFYNKNAHDLSKEICSIFISSLHRKTNIKDRVLSALKRKVKKINGMNNPTLKQSLIYLNKHKNSMMCLDENNQMIPFILYGYRKGEGFGYIFLEKIIDETFIDENNEDLIFNINSITINIKGELETPLDYLKRLNKKTNLTPFQKKKIKHAIDLLKDYNGKSYSELSKEEKKIPIYR